MKALKKGVTVIVSIALWGVILLAALFAFTTLATRDNAMTRARIIAKNFFMVFPPKFPAGRSLLQPTAHRIFIF